MKTAPLQSLPPPDCLNPDAGISLFLDLDGTLTPIAPTPDAAGPDGPRNGILSRLERLLHGRLAIISGRSIADIDRILNRSVMAVAGVHGLERRSASGKTEIPSADPALGMVRAEFGALSKTHGGLILEDKSVSVALHYRGAPRMEREIQDIGRRIAQDTGLVLQLGSMVVELKTPGPDKGDAIRAFLSEPPFAGAKPVFAGDDLTDEHGFAAVEDIGGTGILVGPPRVTKASRRLTDVDAVLAWLFDMSEKGKAP